MMHPPTRTLQAFAQGAVDLPSRLLVEAHRTLCPECSVLIRQYDELAEDLAGWSEDGDVRPPGFDRVWAAAERATVTRGGPTAVLPPSLRDAVPEPAAWRWYTLWPRRARFALLVRDPDTRSALYLSCYGKDTSFPRHAHLGLEENVILAGGYHDGPNHVETGDWVIEAAGTEHMPATGSDEECWCVSRVEWPGVRFTRWRRWLQDLLDRLP